MFFRTLCLYYICVACDNLRSHKMADVLLFRGSIMVLCVRRGQWKGMLGCSGNNGVRAKRWPNLAMCRIYHSKGGTATRVRQGLHWEDSLQGHEWRSLQGFQSKRSCYPPVSYLLRWRPVQLWQHQRWVRRNTLIYHAGISIFSQRLQTKLRDLTAAVFIVTLHSLNVSSKPRNSSSWPQNLRIR